MSLEDMNDKTLVGTDGGHISYGYETCRELPPPGTGHLRLAIKHQPPSRAEHKPHISHFGKLLKSTQVMIGHLGEKTWVLDPRLDDLDKTIDSDEAVYFLAGNVPIISETKELYRMLDEYLGRPEAFRDSIDNTILMIELGVWHIMDTPDVAEPLLGTLGVSYQERFEQGGDMSDIDRSIYCYSRAISLTSANRTGRPRLLNNQGNSYLSRFKRTGDPADVDQAIEVFARAASLITTNPPLKSTMLDNLGIAYSARFRLSGHLPDIDKAIDHKHEALALLPDGHKDIPDRLESLGLAYQSRFARLGRITDINNALSLCSDGHTDSASYHSNLGMAYQSRFRSSGELDDLQLAIHHETLAVESTPHASPEKPLRLSNLGISYHSRYSYLGDPKDLERAIEYDQQAVSLTPDGHTAMPRLLNSLGASYRTRFKRLGNIADIDEAIKHLDQAVSLTPSEHASYPVQLANLGEVYLERFDRLREDANLDVAIDNLNKAISLVPNGHAEMAIWLDTLGIALTRRFEHRSSLEDLNWAIKCQTQAVSLPSHEHTEKPSRLNNLGNSYHRRFKHRGELEDLQKAIECQSLAVSLIPEKHVGKPNILNSLGTSYTSRFEFSGALEDIDRAISYEGEAVDLTPNEDSSKPTRLNSLGGSYHRRFGSLREPEDLEKAIGCFEQALSYSPEGHPEQPLLLGNLGVSYELRFLVLGALPDNDKAVDYLNQAVLLSPSEDVNKAMFLSGLGGAYLARCDKLEKLSDLNKAIDCLYEATNLTPMEHPTSGYRYHDLGVAYARRFKSQIGTNADSANAIIYLNYADVAVPDGHDLKIRILTHIGDIYCSRYDKLNEQEDITQSMSHYQQAAESPTGLPSSKFTAALAWATLSVYHDAALSLKAYRRVMELLHQVVWIGTAARRRYEDLSKFANIATEVAGFAISTGEYELALEWLEQGRSMIWNQMLQLRTPLDELAAVDPKLAQELKEVANQLDQSSPSETIDRTLLSTSVKSLEKAAQGHRHLAKRWDDLLNKARQLPGMSGLLRPKRFSEIARAAESSTIVVVNIYRERCDALVIPENTTSVTHIPLADFYEQAREWHTDLISSLQHAHVRSRALRRPVFDEVDNEDRFESVLATLWDHVASPVLAHLGYLSGENTDQLPRVTWCATGPLAFLPIHAAGYYDESPSRVFDYVVSSYTPTLSSMLVLRQVPTEFRGILAVGQANTAGCAPLPGTVAELEAISAQVGGLRYTKLDGEDATAGAILAEMGAHDWVHLACHGSQNSSDPTKSAFHVHGGTLELATIAHKSMKGVGLAFLSACQTATGDEKLPEEAVHLAAGMIVAGYHTVIATMWSIHDEDAPLIAEKVYGSLLKDGIPDVRRTARALHEAVGCLREKVGDKSYSRWVPYLQLGV